VPLRAACAPVTAIIQRLEAFSLGKRFDAPEANEDSLVVMAGIGYAVIDGVTDHSGARYDGMLSGQFASRLVKRAIESFLAGLARGECRYEGPAALVASLGEAIRAGYEANGVLETVRADWKLRAGCTVMLAFHRDDALECVAVGDSGARINGKDIFQVLKPLDDVTSTLRREAWHYFAAEGRDDDACDTLARAMTWMGTRFQQPGSPTAEAKAVDAIESRALAACRQRHPSVPEWELLELIRKGIAHGQGGFRNVTDRVLGYGGLDGFDVPAQHIATRRYRLDAVDSLELFTGGYFKPGTGFGVASWEEAFAEVERDDPHKIGSFASTKGSTPTAFADDRTYIGVMLR
jgi:hypothetical protein